jgi:hypothetical protein
MGDTLRGECTWEEKEGKETKNLKVVDVLTVEK